MARTTIPAELVAINAIQGTLIADNAITAVHIATNAVSGTLVADNAITSTHIAQNNVTATQIAMNTITVTQLADSAVETAKLNNDAVTQAKIADDAVGADQLAANSVVSASIVNGSIVAADMADNAVTLAKMASLARGSIIVGDSAGDPSALSIGSNTYVLTSDGTDISWAAASGGVAGISSSADATAITIDSSENVGIGNTSPGFKLTIGGGIGTNQSTVYTSMTGQLGFGNDYSDTQRGPNKIVLQNDGAWIAGLGISDGSVDLYSGGKFTFLDSAGANSYATRMVIDNNGKVGINASSPGSTFSVGHTADHTNNRITIFSDDYNYGQIRVGSSTSEASIGFMRSTTQANTDAQNPSGGNNTWAIGLGVWGANFGIGSNSILDNCVEWDSSGHMLPGSNNTYDLGSTAAGWRNIYTNDLHLSNMAPEGEDMEGNAYTREGNEVDGTNGSWTIQEGANDLYLLNRLNGKKYKFKLEEIS